MRNLDKEFDLYARLVVLAENLMPMSPLSELARCYEEPGTISEEGKTDERERTKPKE